MAFSQLESELGWRICIWFHFSITKQKSQASFIIYEVQHEGFQIHFKN